MELQEFDRFDQMEAFAEAFAQHRNESSKMNSTGFHQPDSSLLTFDALHTTRLVTGRTDLVRMYKGRLLLNRTTRDLLENDGMTEITARRLHTHVTEAIRRPHEAAKPPSG